MWRGYVIKGKVSYLAPWKRVVKFANEIAATIVTRFPPEDFLKSLDVVDPREWLMHMIQPSMLVCSQDFQC